MRFMITETRRVFLRRLLIMGGGAVAAACEQILEDPQNLAEIRDVEKAQKEAMERIKAAVRQDGKKQADAVKEALKKERFIPLPKVDGVDIDNHTESAQYGGLVIKLPKLDRKFTFPSLVKGTVLGLHEDLGTGIKAISVSIDDVVAWQFEARAKPLIKRGGDKISVGQPIFEYDLAADDNAHKIRGYIRGFLVYSYPFDNGRADVRLSDVTRENILLNPRNAQKFQEISALRFAA